MPIHPGRGRKGAWAALGTGMARVEGCREKRHKACPRKRQAAATRAPFAAPRRGPGLLSRGSPPRPLLRPASLRPAPPHALLRPRCRPTSHSPGHAGGPGARGQSQLQLPPSERSIKRTRGPSNLSPPQYDPMQACLLLPPLWSWDPSIQPPATWRPLPPLPTTKPSGSPPWAPPDWLWLQPERPPPPMPLTATASHC